jgi:hypothetical protein
MALSRRTKDRDAAAAPSTSAPSTSAPSTSAPSQRVAQVPMVLDADAPATGLVGWSADGVVFSKQSSGENAAPVVCHASYCGSGRASGSASSGVGRGVPLQVRVRRAELVRVIETRRNRPTLVLRVPKPTTRALIELDEHCVAVAQGNVEQWFGRDVDPGLVEEYFHASTVADRSRGLLARFSVTGPPPAPLPPTPAGARTIIDVTLQLVGLNFLRQHFVAQWKVVDLRSAAPLRADGRGNTDDASTDDDDDDDEDGAFGRGDLTVGPTPDEYDEMVADLRTHLDAERQALELRLRDLDAATEALDRAAPGDLAVLDRGWDVLDDGAGIQCQRTDGA